MILESAKEYYEPGLSSCLSRYDAVCNEINVGKAVASHVDHNLRIKAIQSANPLMCLFEMETMSAHGVSLIKSQWILFLSWPCRNVNGLTSSVNKFPRRVTTLSCT
jgi:hypothetical protein